MCGTIDLNDINDFDVYSNPNNPYIKLVRGVTPWGRYWAAFCVTSWTVISWSDKYHIDILLIIVHEMYEELPSMRSAPSRTKEKIAIYLRSNNTRAS